MGATTGKGLRGAGEAALVAEAIGKQKQRQTQREGERGETGQTMTAPRVGDQVVLAVSSQPASPAYGLRYNFDSCLCLDASAAS